MKYAAAALCALVFVPTAYSAVTRQDYERAATINERYSKLTEDVVRGANWVEGEDVLLYDKSIAGGGHRFFLADAKSGERSAAFDHVRIAAAMSEATHAEMKPDELSFRDARLVEHRNRLRFRIGYTEWSCDLKAYHCGKAESERDDEDPNAGQTARNSNRHSVESPDKQWRAFVLNYNVVVKSQDGKQSIVLSTDGSEGDYYDLQTAAWSPDSKRLVLYRVRPGYHRTIRFVESSPADQLQPLYPEIPYTKPGDVLDLPQPVLFDVTAKREIPIARDLFPNPFDLSPARWWADSRGFTFEYNQRGHQLYRVIEVDGVTGAARTLIEEASPTFVDYRPLVPDQQDTGKEFRQDIDDGKEILWASERDGWEHLYLFDGKTGAVKNQITHGDWPVRSIDRVDAAKRLIWFSASGVTAGEDPYFVHAYRIAFDGSGLTPLTPAAGNHRVEYSDDGAFYFDLVSTVSNPPTLSLYRTESGSKVAELERGKIDKLQAAGWQAPEVFHSPGRDGHTEIWGIVWKPADFDPKQHYPVIEDIYAGPQGSFVPKSFSTRVESLTQLGFVVVQIDGMGTNNRSRAFHNVAWKNLKDAGFEDRILWHKAYAASHPWYDITRVGIFGTSAGGQSAMGALLFHPEFYKVAVANSGCHDNRMDKIWWNEQWMGWPIGPEYSASSNVDNAWRLQGKLMLVVGEMDDNVDPSSTFQVADRLEKANKYFDLLYVPGGKHGAGGEYGQRKLQDFFVRNLIGQSTPDWNIDASSTAAH
jgi:dipeptidyl aminopeptidase/acylaminoacyl peptidase